MNLNLLYQHKQAGSNTNDCGNTSNAEDFSAAKIRDTALKVGRFQITGAESSDIIVYFDVDNAGSDELTFVPTGYAMSGDMDATATGLADGEPVVRTFTESNDMDLDAVTLLAAGGGATGGTGRVEDIGLATGYANLFVVGDLVVDALPGNEGDTLFVNYTVNVLYK